MIHTCWICENAVEDTLSDGATSLSTWSKPDDEVIDTVRLRSGPGVAGSGPTVPEVVSAEVEEVGIVKQVDRRPSNKFATSFIYGR